MLKSSEKSKGFTLVELLVVVTIVMLLATFILIPLARYRDNAKDARIESSLTQVKKTAAMIFSDEDSYTSVCAADNTLNEAVPALKSIEDDVARYTSVACYDSAAAYCVQSPLIRVAGSKYCVDSFGYSGRGQTNCSNINIKCAP